MRFISYERFGVAFMDVAVTPERVRAAIASVAGERIEVGPLNAGPGGAARVRASGRVGAIEVTQHTGRPLRFTATVPVAIRLDVRLAGTRHVYGGQIRVPLELTVRTAAPLTIVIDVAEVRPRDVTVDLKASGVRARWLQRIGGVDDEVRSRVVAVVNERLASDETTAARRIDVLALIEGAWEGQS